MDRRREYRKSPTAVTKAEHDEAKRRWNEIDAGAPKTDFWETTRLYNIVAAYVHLDPHPDK